MGRRSGRKIENLTAGDGSRRVEKRVEWCLVGFLEHVLRLGQGTWMVGIRSKDVDSLDQRFSSGA